MTQTAKRGETDTGQVEVVWEDGKVVSMAKSLLPKDKPKTPKSAPVHVKTEDQERVEEFARLVAGGMDGTQAVLQVGLAKGETAAKRKSTALLRLPAVQKILDQTVQRNETAAEQEGVTPNWLISQLKHEALNSHVPSARVRALELLGRVIDLYASDKPQQTDTGTFLADVSDDDDGDDPDLA